MEVQPLDQPDKRHNLQKKCGQGKKKRKAQYLAGFEATNYWYYDICSTAKPQLLLQSRMATFDHFKQWFSNSFKLQCRTTKQKRPKVFKGSQLTQKWPPGFWFQLPPRPRRWVPWSWASERPARSRPGGPSGSRRRRCRWTPRCQTATLKPRLKIQKNHKPVSFFNFNSELRCFFEACFVSSLTASIRFY